MTQGVDVTVTVLVVAPSGYTVEYTRSVWQYFGRGVDVKEPVYTVLVDSAVLVVVLVLVHCPKRELPNWSLRGCSGRAGSNSGVVEVGVRLCSSVHERRVGVLLTKRTGDRRYIADIGIDASPWYSGGGDVVVDCALSVFGHGGCSGDISWACRSFSRRLRDQDAIGRSGWKCVARRGRTGSNDIGQTI